MPAIALIVCMGLCLLSHGLAHYDDDQHSHKHHHHRHHGHQQQQQSQQLQPAHQYIAEHDNQLEKLHQPHAAHHARHQHQHHSHYHHGHRDRSNQVLRVEDEREPSGNMVVAHDNKQQHLHHHPVAERRQQQQQQQRDKVHKKPTVSSTAEATVFSVSLNIDGQTMPPHPTTTTTTMPSFYLHLNDATPSPSPSPTPLPTTTTTTNVTNARQPHHHQKHHHPQHEHITTVDNRLKAVQPDRRAAAHKRTTLDYSDKDDYEYADDDYDTDADADAAADDEHGNDDLDMAYDSEIIDNLNGNEAADWLGHRQRLEGYTQVTPVFNDLELKRPQRGALNANQSEAMYLDDYADDEPHRGNDDDLYNYQQDAASPATQQQQQQQKPGVVTEQKYKEVGSPEAVQRAHESYVQQQELNALARQHIMRMRMASCRNPQARVVNVSNDTSKRYVPHRTILHRCGDDTGCCDVKDICVAKSTEIVQLYFFVYTMESKQFFTEMKRLPNDTECHCIKLDEYENARRNKRHNAREHISRRYYYNLPTHHQQQQPQQQWPGSAEAACKCPSHFEQFIAERTASDKMRFDYVFHSKTARHSKYREPPCRCDCSSSNETCKRLQNGQDGFAINDRLCIAEQRCQPPKCSTGVYNIPAGRCPTLRTDYAYG